MAVSSFKRSLYTSNPDKYISFLAGNDYYDPGAFVSIATAIGTGSSGTITFSSIPSTYSSLQIRVLCRSSSTGRNIQVRFNSDTGANYAQHNLRGNGTSAAAAGTASTTSIESGWIATSADATNVMGVSIIDLHDYASTTKNKTLRAISGIDNNNLTTTNERIYLYSGLWMNTAAVNSISLVSNSGNWTTASVFSLYGIKGA
jgi:hypothetical protein